ncbi:MAG: DUF3316 domain-containing protein [Muribaculaceae bacterium]|nr:DUF3316 domain-containing protein [Muribaculaceae bacterium]
MTRILKLISLLILLTIPSVSAQDSLPRPVTSSYRIEIGRGEARSTYLSPLKYSGTALGVSGEWAKAFQKNPEHIVMTFAGEMTCANMLNPPATARMYQFEARFNWGMAYRQRLPYNLQFTVGGLLDINGGALYIPRNGNNPVTVLANIGIDADASLSWHFNIGKLPLLLTESVKLPAVGAFFSPQYGETLYEVYLGNHKGLAHCGWWGNNFGIDNYLSIRMDFGRTAMELGYRYDYRSFHASDLTTRRSRNMFVIGIIPHGIGLKHKRKANYAGY